MIPKWLRRRVYNRLLKRAEQQTIFLCGAIKKEFPYAAIYRYKELWDRRENLGNCLIPFDTHKERIEYLKEAIKLTQNGT